MSDFRIAQLTDLHLTTRRDWLNPVEDVEGAVDFIRRAYVHFFQGQPSRKFSSVFHPSGYNADAAQKALHSIFQDNFDAILITGDLATTGEDTDIRVAVDYLNGKAPDWWHGGGRIPSLIGNVPVIAMPGNHDRYSGPFAIPGSKQFEQHLGLYWDLEQDITYSHKFPHEESGRVRITTLEREGKLLAVIMADMCLDSANQAQGGKFAYYGQGQVSKKVLAELTEATELVYQEAEEGGLPVGVLWAVHFPPDYPNVKPDLTLQNGADLVQAALGMHVPVIVAGHTHQTGEYLAYSQNQGVRIVCSGPTCGLGEHGQYAYTVLEIDIPASKQIVCTPKYYKWVDSSFVEQAQYPAIY